MSGAAAWGLLGVAVLVVPGAGARRSLVGSRNQTGRRHRNGPAGSAMPGARRHRDEPAGRKPERAGPLVAGAAAGAACVALLGVSVGGIVGAAVGALVYATLDWLQRRPVSAAPDPALPLVLDLLAAALRSGQPLADALALSAGAARDDVEADLRRVAGLCRLGAEPAQAWAAVARDGPLAAVAPVAVRSAHSGIRIAGAFERLAAELRAEQAARRAARAARAGVRALGPLAACFLPAFLCLGVVPVIVGIATTALGVLPGGR